MILKELQHVSGRRHPKIRVHVDLIDAAAADIDQLGNVDAVGIFHLPAQRIDSGNKFLRHRGGTVADQKTVDLFMAHALFGGDGDFTPDFCILSLVGTVHRAIADGKGVHSRFFEKINRLHRVGVGGCLRKHMILDACQNAQFSLYRHAKRMRIFDHFSGQLHIFLIGEGTAVDHDGSIAALNTGLDALQRFAVIQVQGDRNLTFPSEFPHDLTKIPGALLFALQGAVHEVLLSPHEGVGGFRPLQDAGAVKQFMDLHCRRNLVVTVHVKSRLTVSVSICRLQNTSHRY